MRAARNEVAARRAAVESASFLARSAIGAVLVAAVVGALSHSGAMRCALGRGLDGRGRIGQEFAVHAAAQATWFAAGVLFLMWVHRAVSSSRLLGVPVKWGPWQAVLAFVVPVVSVVLPYYVMKALFRASDPSVLGDVPMFRQRAEASYREGGRELVASPRWIFPAPILAWWILFETRMLVDMVDSAGGALALRAAKSACGLAMTACQLGAGVLCVLVVRSVDARQRERCRRLEAIEDIGVAP
jgi:Domain of unknown function (DUF4328)